MVSPLMAAVAREFTFSNAKRLSYAIASCAIILAMV